MLKRRNRRTSIAVGVLVACATPFVVPPGPSGAAFGQAQVPASASQPARADAWRLKALDALSTWVDKQGGTLSVYFLDLNSGREARINDGTPLNPASNMKIVTATLALDRLGPTHSYRTAVYGAVDSDGAAATLILRGDGDPSLEEADLWRLAHSLVNRGLRQVGVIEVDQRAFDDQFVPPAFEQQPNEWAAFRAPISALAIDRNTVTLNVLPGTPDGPARTWFEPDGVVGIEGTVKTVSKGKGQNIQLSLRQREAGGLTATLGGHIAAGLGRQRFSKRLEDPRLVPGLVLAAALKRLGVQVGPVKLGSTGDAPRLSYIASKPLSQLLSVVGKNSDNFSAETIFKSLSALNATPASTAASAQVALDWLNSIQKLPAGTLIRNGSGLFDANRLSASTLVSVLRFAYEQPVLREAVLAQLAVGGADGTLTNRFRDPKTKGQVRAKTGTLNAAIALSGYLLGKGTRAPVVFSVLVNGVAGRAAAVRQRVDAVVDEALAELE